MSLLTQFYSGGGDTTLVNSPFSAVAGYAPSVVVEDGGSFAAGNVPGSIAKITSVTPQQVTYQLPDPAITQNTSIVFVNSNFYGSGTLAMYGPTQWQIGATSTVKGFTKLKNFVVYPDSVTTSTSTLSEVTTLDGFVVCQGFSFNYNPYTFSCPALTTITGPFGSTTLGSGNFGLFTLNAPNLTTFGGTITWAGSFTGTGGGWDFSPCPLNQAAVDNILVQYAAISTANKAALTNSKIYLKLDGNCAAPSATGSAAAGTIALNGGTVTTN